MGYNILSQLCLWLILPLISTFASFTLISNKHINIINYSNDNNNNNNDNNENDIVGLSVLEHSQPIIILICFVIMLSICLNNQYNSYLTLPIYNRIRKHE